MGKCSERAPDRLILAINQFNNRDWFECHETLEDIWMAEDGEARHLYQGILQVAVALYHWERGNFGGAVGLLKTGIDYLRGLQPVCQQVDLAAFVESADKVRDTLARLGEERMAELGSILIPRLRLVSGQEIFAD